MLKTVMLKMPFLKMCVEAKNRKKKFNKNPYFEVSKSFKVIDVYSNKKLVYS